MFIHVYLCINSVLINIILLIDKYIMGLLGNNKDSRQLICFFFLTYNYKTQLFLNNVWDTTKY